MKEKLLVVIMIGLMLTVGMVWMGCEPENNCPDGGDCKLRFEGRGFDNPPVSLGGKICSGKYCMAKSYGNFPYGEVREGGSCAGCM